MSESWAWAQFHHVPTDNEKAQKGHLEQSLGFIISLGFAFLLPYFFPCPALSQGPDFLF